MSQPIPQRQSAGASRNRAALAALLDALFPGVGHWYLGYRRRGRNMMLITGSALLLVALIAGQGLDFALKLLVQPTTLTLIYAANLAFFFYRAWAATRAYQLGMSDRPPAEGWSPLAVGLLLTAAVTVVLPHAVVGFADLVQYDLVTSIFGANEPSAAAQPASSGDEPADRGPVVASGGATTSVATTTTTTIPPPIWEGRDRLNVLLLGGDAGPGRRGIRTDTMMVASVDPATGYAALFSVPRNFVGVPVPPEWDIWEGHVYPDQINALYQYAHQNPDQFPTVADPGAYAMKQAFSQLLGIPVHYYALVDLNGFVEIIDAVGGVTITVTQRVFDATYPHEDGTIIEIDIEPGTYDMDGHTALAYARSRRTSDDYNRMSRQRCVLEALVAQANPATVAIRFPAIAGAIKDNMSTDIPLNQLPNFVDLLPVLSTDEVVTVRFIPPDWHTGRTRDRYPIPDVPKIQNAVQTIMDLPPAQAIEVLGLVDLDDACREEAPAEEAPGGEETTSTTSPATTLGS